MRRWILSLCLIAAWSLAQKTSAQVVQLPTFHYFSVATTVVVPDRGSTYLGGVNRARFGSTMNGVPGLSKVPGAGRLFGNRGIGSEVSSTGAHASATIMDLGELDRQVLADAAARRGDAPVDPAIARKAAFIARNIARSNIVPAEPTKETPKRTSMADQKTIRYANPEEEAREAYQLAQKAEADGHLATARIHYKRASLLSKSRLRDDAKARLDALTPTPNSPDPNSPDPNSPDPNSDKRSSPNQ